MHSSIHAFFASLGRIPTPRVADIAQSFALSLGDTWLLPQADDETDFFSAGLCRDATGCAVSKDGIGLAQRPADANKVTAVREQLQRNADVSAGSEVDQPATKKHPGFFVVGTTGPLRPAEAEDRGAFYAAYLQAAERWHPNVPPALSEADFQQKFAGWASIQIAGIPGIGSIRMRVLVPADLARETRFASAAGSLLIGTTGDLVAAKLDDDGLLWLERILCKDDATYHACAGDYEKGIFDKNTGQELDRDRKPKPNGRVANIETYRKL